jgi:hypothetical protein
MTDEPMTPEDRQATAEAQRYRDPTLAAIRGWMQRYGVRLPVDVYSASTVDHEPETILAMHPGAVYAMAKDAQAYREMYGPPQRAPQQQPRPEQRPQSQAEPRPPTDAQQPQSPPGAPR